MPKRVATYSTELKVRPIDADYVAMGIECAICHKKYADDAYARGDRGEPLYYTHVDPHLPFCSSGCATEHFKQTGSML